MRPWVEGRAGTTALPQIGKDTGASFTDLEWVINAYAQHSRRTPKP